MKVFVSWSGKASQQIAVALREWLPCVLQSVVPYVSSEDIDKGARWSQDIAGELESSSYGIICITADNFNAPWINFEAGALGKSVDTSRVTPLLFRLPATEIPGKSPLVQFQAAQLDRSDMLKTLKSINSALGEKAIKEGVLEASFQAFWPKLEAALNTVKVEPSNTPARRSTEDVLEELVSLARQNHAILSRPDHNQKYTVNIDNLAQRGLSIGKVNASWAHASSVPHQVANELAEVYSILRTVKPECDQIDLALNKIASVMDVLNLWKKASFSSGGGTAGGMFS